MKLSLLLTSFAASTTAFAPAKSVKTTTELNMDRRDFITGVTCAIVAGVPAVASAKPASTWFFDDSQVYEAAQQPTGDRLDLNSAFVGDYKTLPGMFPHAAGKLASNGPYKTVKDIYKIDGLTDNDVKVFKKYEKYFTANPPGRAFDERINARVST